ncbi:right-handed parallel beta-helix repeat-containing protein [Desulforegula conservatrix]|uniref:right-handed parallel beta-helix repeat-containing protein n=1 Tax=Desulforegula conservatrix TaxID=153026 RepID=UPI00041F2545|nr:right-handed parallel beta-helix repeat-containing protein [Desulforegula conservatrix]
MCKILKLIILIACLLILIPGIALSTTYYACPSTVVTAGAGTRDAPWKANAINWTSVLPGDTIYLRTTLGSYNETITIGKSGTAGNYIVIASDPIDGGKAVIDGQSTRLEGITHSSKTYISVKNVKIQKTTGANNRAILPGSYWKIGSGVEISNCGAGMLYNGNVDPYVDGITFTEVGTLIQFYNVTGTITCKNVSAKNSSAVSGHLRVGGTSTTGVLNFESISLDGGNASGNGYGLLCIDYGVFTGTSYIRNMSVKNSSLRGIYLSNCSGFNFYTTNSTNNALSGLGIYGGCSNIKFYGSRFDKNADDGVDFVGTSHDLDFWFCFADSNGYPIPNDPVNSGDGFSAHDTCYNINQYFCVTVGNRNSGFAHVGSSAGVLYHCTYAFNGNQAAGTNRGGILINTTGDNPNAPVGSKSWKIKNCIGYKNYPRELALTSYAKSSITADYNSYRPLDDARFATYDWGGTYADVTWSAYKGTYEPNSKNEDSKVMNNGMISPKSPCVDAAPWIPGVNDSGQTDPWGKRVYGLPNIGADQGAGMSATGNRPSMGFRIGM